ncbi:hypothetical protein J437_LFUL011945 [Ladona fulva]|uniref:Uncharacterized protein n=1 Tax=Ladona fulva TaxID=123851 RepID=A0A8K0JVP3_LADFU|nr:hypothetical protein J437_LFUL011945 [Ladona fulva]
MNVAETRWRTCVWWRCGTSLVVEVSAINSRQEDLPAPDTYAKRLLKKEYCRRRIFPLPPCQILTSIPSLRPFLTRPPSPPPPLSFPTPSPPPLHSRPSRPHSSPPPPAIPTTPSPPLPSLASHPLLSPPLSPLQTQRLIIKCMQGRSSERLTAARNGRFWRGGCVFRLGDLKLFFFSFSFLPSLPLSLSPAHHLAIPRRRPKQFRTAS